MENKGVIENIQKHYNEFSRMEKKAADWVLRYPDVVVEYTVKELSKESDVSEATVVRMCKHAGYTGYWAFRTMLARDMGTARKEENLDVDEENVIKSIFQKYADTMLTLGDKINMDTMKACVKLFNECHQVHIIATGDTGTMATHMGFRLGRIGIKNTYCGLADYFINTINLAEEDDILVAISKSGVSKNVIQGIELAKKKGLKVVAITEYENSKVGELADYVLPCKGDSSRFDYYKNYSHLSVTAVIEVLMDLLTNQDKIIEKEADMLEFIMSETKL